MEHWINTAIVVFILLMLCVTYALDRLSIDRRNLVRVREKRAANKMLAACNKNWAAILDDMIAQIEERDATIEELTKKLERYAKIMEASPAVGVRVKA